LLSSGVWQFSRGLHDRGRRETASRKNSVVYGEGWKNETDQQVSYIFESNPHPNVIRTQFLAIS